MSTSILTNITSLVNCRSENKLLRGLDLSVLPCINNAYIIIEGREIASFGEMKDLKYSKGEQISDLTGRMVLPSWCDSHTHLVFAGSRENEFVDKIKGLSYAEIAAKGGGILNSARILNDISEQALYEVSRLRLLEIARLGTGAVEIKSGYGLTVGGELKMLRVIKRLKQESNMLIKSTFLAAHTYPPAYRNDHQAYIRLIINEMLPVIAAEQLADYIDVFCETGFFSPQETEQVCRAGMMYGLKPKIHANQLSLSGGVETGLRLQALSVDHLETMNEKLIRELAGSGTIGTLLPGAAFFLGMRVGTARFMIDSGCAIALASDYNPGSSPSGNMNLILSLACIQMKFLPKEAINAATINGAYAMEVEKLAGSIMTGKRANLIVTQPIPSLAYLPYSFGSNLVHQAILAGEPVDP
ncbi:MAG: imidazolonepropionase [Chitinophagaceae bacterium]|nr:MAG: imidazolonepropionase [Chitinophagaceae bacterium]